jgi:hypothetical protein
MGYMTFSGEGFCLLPIVIFRGCDTVKSAPSEAPGGGMKGDRTPPGMLQILLLYINNRHGATGRKKKYADKRRNDCIHHRDPAHAEQTGPGIFLLADRRKSDIMCETYTNESSIIKA